MTNINISILTIGNDFIHKTIVEHLPDKVYFNSLHTKKLDCDTIETLKKCQYRNY